LWKRNRYVQILDYKIQFDFVHHVVNVSIR